MANPEKEISRAYNVATDYLKSVGIRVLDREYHATEGDLQIVATERDSLVVVHFASSIPRELMQSTRTRLRKGAVAWMNAHGVRFDRVRVDVMVVTLLPMGQSNIEHVRGMG